MLTVIFLIFHLVFALMIFFLTIAFVTGAPFVPSRRPVAESMLKLAKLKPTDIVYDLGSGDGRLILAAAKNVKYAVGLEINPFLVFLSNFRKLLSHERDRIRFSLSNFWKANISDADVVFVYLLPWKMETLERKLTDNLKPGTRIVSNSFIFPNLRMTGRDERNHVYVFEV